MNREAERNRWSFSPVIRRFIVVGACCVVVTQGAAVAQEPWSSWIAVSGGMGISAVSAPSVVDYVNGASQAPVSERASEFSSATEFVVVPEIRVAEEWAVGIDYHYRIKSLAVNSAGSQSRFESSSHHLGLVVHYLIEGESYLVRIGGGGGPVLGSFSQALFGSSVFSDFSARGGSVKVEAIGDTKFDDHFYGTIGVDMQWVFGQTYHDGSREVRAGTLRAGLSSFAFGIKLGVLIRT